MKKCIGCGAIKETDEFNKQRRNKDGLNRKCRACQNEWQRVNYKTNDKRKEQIRKAEQAAVKRNRDLVIQNLKRGCVDCGYSNILALDFDHVSSDKEFTIADKLSSAMSEKRLQKEIDKCEVVCSNCHRIRTSDRIGGNWKTQYMTI
jgi:vacuolar-type H+-ATPase subunit D/Vma8